MRAASYWPSRIAAGLLSACLVCAACSSSQPGARQLARIEYRLSRDVMWTEIVSVLRSKYRDVRLAELSASRLVTDWLDTHQRYTARGSSLGVRNAPVVTRITINLVGTNPYRVEVRMEAAVWWGNAAPWPIPPGADMPFSLTDRETWLARAIHDELTHHGQGR